MGIKALMKPLPSLVISLRPLKSYVQQIINISQGINTEGVDLNDLIDLELECLLSDPRSKYFSTAYDDFFERYIVHPDGEQAVVARVHNYLTDRVIDGWGKPNRWQSYEWTVDGNILTVKHVLPLRIRIPRKLTESEKLSYAFHSTDEISRAMADGSISGQRNDQMECQRHH